MIHAGSSLADKISHPFMFTINLVHQHKSLVVMRAAVKQDPARRNSKGKEWETERERTEGTVHCSALSPINLTCATCVYVSVAKPTRQFQQTVLWGVAGRKWMGPARNKREKMKDQFLLTFKMGYRKKSKRVMPTYLMWNKKQPYSHFSFNQITNFTAPPHLISHHIISLQLLF